MLIKKVLKKSFLGKLTLSEFHVLECRILPKIIDDEKFVRHYYKKYSDKALNLDNPRTFSEKVNWYKLNHKIPLMQQCADKVEVREYVAEKGYSEHLNKIIGIYSCVDEIDIGSLPERFVLKAAHGSHMNIIVKDNKDKINWKQQKMMMRSWLKQDIYWPGREWVYKDLKRRIIAEEYLEDETGELRDYKFFCFNGIPRFVQVEVGRFGHDHARNFYDMDWKLQPFGKEIPCNPDVNIEKPAGLEMMKQMAKDLSKPFEFVRVDLYQLKDEVRFGELTFFPAGGKPDFVPKEYDEIVGDMWEMNVDKTIGGGI